MSEKSKADRRRTLRCILYSCLTDIMVAIVLSPVISWTFCAWCCVSRVFLVSDCYSFSSRSAEAHKVNDAPQEDVNCCACPCTNDAIPRPIPKLYAGGKNSNQPDPIPTRMGKRYHRPLLNTPTAKLRDSCPVKQRSFPFLPISTT